MSDHYDPNTCATCGKPIPDGEWRRTATAYLHDSPPGGVHASWHDGCAEPDWSAYKPMREPKQ